MPHCIVRIVEPLLRLIRPAPGRHRSPGRQSAGLCAQTPAAHRSRVPAARDRPASVLRLQRGRRVSVSCSQGADATRYTAVDAVAARAEIRTQGLELRLHDSAGVG